MISLNRKLYRCLLGLGLLCSLSSISVMAAGDTELKAMAKSAGEVRVIVTFKDAGGNSKQSAKSNGSPILDSKQQLEQLRSRQNLLTAKINTKRRLKTKRFDLVSQMVLSVSELELAELLDDPSIDVQADVLRKPLLSSSVKKVYSNQDFSTFHGNNEWTVAILDSGVHKAHPFLTNKVVSEACYSDGGGQVGTTSLCPNGVTSSTASGSGEDCPASVVGCSHGTHIAGIAAGNGASFDGVARDAKLISIQIYSRVDDVDFCFPQTSCLGAYSSDLIAAMQRVYDLRNTYKIAAVNISSGSGLFTGSCDNQPEKPIIDLLRSANIATVIASGNSGSDSELAAPACISTAVAVGSTDTSTNSRSSFSNSSTVLDLYAPGNGISSSVPNSGYASKSGTSFATPHVSGAFAVLKHALPSASIGQIENMLKSNGPIVTVAGVQRRRIDIRSVLRANGFNFGITLAPVYLLLLGDD